MNIEPVLAEPSDLDFLVDFYIATRQYFSNLIPPIVGTREGVKNWLTSRIRRSDEVWLVKNNQDIIALLMLEPGWIDQLYLRPDSIRQGIGSSLVDFAKFRFPDGLQLWTFQSNLPAQKFYEKHGFVSVEYTDGQTNQEKSPDIRYLWVPNALQN